VVHFVTNGHDAFQVIAPGAQRSMKHSAGIGFHLMKKLHHIALATLLAAASTLAHAGPIGYSAWDVGGNDKLVRFDLSTGVGTVIGTNLGFTDVDGLAFNASSELFGVDDSTNNLLKIDTNTGLAAAVGSLESPGSTSFNDMGLAFIGNTLYMSSTTGGGTGGLFTVDTSTGGASLIGNFASGVKVRSLGSHGGVLYGWSNTDTLLTLNTSTAATTTVGPFLFSSPTIGQDGMDIDPATGTIWGISEVEKRTYTLDASTGKATTYATSLSCGGAPCTAFNSLAIAAVPEPEGYTLALAGLGVLGLMMRRRSA
jgi:hypothetical protein